MLHVDKGHKLLEPTLDLLSAACPLIKTGDKVDFQNWVIFIHKSKQDAVPSTSPTEYYGTYITYQNDPLNFLAMPDRRQTRTCNHSWKWRHSDIADICLWKTHRLSDEASGFQWFLGFILGLAGSVMNSCLGHQHVLNVHFGSRPKWTGKVQTQGLCFCDTRCLLVVRCLLTVALGVSQLSGVTWPWMLLRLSRKLWRSRIGALRMVFRAHQI